MPKIWGKSSVPRLGDRCAVRQIDFRGRPDLGGALHPEIAKLPELQYLDLDDSNVSGSLEFLANNTKLRWLRLRHTRVGGDLEDLPKAEYLCELDLSGTKVTGDLAALANFTKLERLRLSNTAVLGELKSLAKLERLEYLELGNLKVVGELESLAKLERLKELDLSETAVLGELKSLANFTELARLHLSNTAVLGDLKSLPKTKEWRELSLGNLQVVGDAAAMAEWSKIQHVDLSGTQVEFVKTDNLQQFQPYCLYGWKCLWPELRFLDVSHTPQFSLAKDLLRPFAGCEKLATLKAAGCGLTGPLWPEIDYPWGDILPMNQWPLSQALSVLDLASNNVTAVAKLPGSCRTLVLTGNPEVSFGAGVLEKAIKDIVFVDLRNATFANPSDPLLLIGQLAVITHLLRSNYCSSCSHFLC